MRGLDIIGADGFDWGGLISKAGQAAGGAVQEQQAKDAATQAAAKATDDAKAKLATVVKADATLAAAMARAATSAAVKSPQQAKADQLAAASAESADASAAAKLPVNMQAGRVDAATTMLDRATAALQTDPTNLDKQNLVDAWQKILVRAQSGQAAANTPGTPESRVEDTGGSFLTATIVGPVKVWMGLVGAAGAGLGAWLWQRK